MSDRTLARLLRVAAVSGGVLALVSAAGMIPLMGFGTWVSEFAAFNILIACFFSVFTWLAAANQPRNPVVWTMASSAFFAGLLDFGRTASFIAFDLDISLAVEPLVPASLPTGAALVLLLTGWTWTLAFLPLLTFGLLLFPDGKLPSRRWRWVGITAAVGILLVSVASAWTYRPSSTQQVDSNPTLESLFTVVIAAAVASLVALLSRFRRSGGDTRQQIKWVLWGASIFLPVFLGLGFILGGTESEHLLAWPLMITESAFLASYGVAVVKYRLYDINVVVSRTLVYVSLAVFIGVVYVGIVVGVGALLGSQGELNVWLGIGATVVVAIAFQPVRRRLQLVANRMIFGRRATPYEVLSAFSQGVAAVDPDVLGQISRSVTEGTTANSASIWVHRSGELHCIASWPEGEPERGSEEKEISHDGERLGLISLTVPPGEPLPPSDEDLVDKLASGLGLVLRNLVLTDELQSRVDQLRESRKRIVSVQDQTRRTLERDLHDGAQQRLVALKIKVGIGMSMAEKEGLEDIARILTTVKDETDLTIDSLRTLARGIYPPLLEAEGLGPALTTQLHRLPVPVTVQAAGVERHPRELEATVYFCVLEAVQNAIRHAQAQSILVSVSESAGYLSFEVRDDGLGFDVDGVEFGPGLINITDRIDAVEGTVEIESIPGHGTVIRGSMPVPKLEPA